MNDIYQQAIANGCSERLAEMLAARQAPGTRGTDRAFLQGYLHNPFAGTPDFIARSMLQQAKAAGINTTGKVYRGGLADWRGPADPQAWVSGIDDVRRVVREKNLNCTGVVNHKAAETQAPDDVPLAESIVQDAMRDEIAVNPEAGKDKAALREKVVAKHGPPSRRPAKKIRELL